MRPLLLLFIAVLLLGSCRPEGTTKQSAAAQAQTSPDNLKLYTHRYPVQDQGIYRSFQARANKGVDVFLHAGKDLVELAKAGRLRGDLVILDDLYQAHQLIKLGVLEPYNAGTFGDYVPSRYVDNEGYWAALTRWTMGFVYRPQAAPMEAMVNYAGILRPELKGRVVMAHPDSSGLITMTAGMIAAHGATPARIYLEQLKAQLAAPPYNNDWEAVLAVAEGTADVALVNTSAYLRYKNSGNPELYRAVEGLLWEIPVDAKNNNYFNITPICLLKQAPYRDYAISMVELLTLRENQGDYAAAYMEYPVNVFSQPNEFLDESFNVAQSTITVETTEKQLDTAADLVREIFAD
ncbi:MAG: hypothetical protein AAGJ82_03545 [Bacteroidota bacterium]